MHKYAGSNTSCTPKIALTYGKFNFIANKSISLYTFLWDMNFMMSHTYTSIEETSPKKDVFLASLKYIYIGTWSWLKFLFL